MAPDMSEKPKPFPADSQDTLADADDAHHDLELGSSQETGHNTTDRHHFQEIKTKGPQVSSSPHPRRSGVNSNGHNDDDDGAETDTELDDGTALGRLASASLTHTRSAVNLPPAPDGGAQAWSQVVAGWLVLFATWGYMNSFGSFQSYYTSSGIVDADPSAISWIGSLQGCLTTAVGVFTGRLLDAGYFRPTFATGAVLQVAGIFAMSASAAPKYYQLLITQGIMSGLGSGILFTPTLALVATWFSSRRGFAIGLATTGNSTGGVVYPLIVRELLPRLGFAWTVRVMGFVNLACFVGAFVLLRSRLPPRKSGAVIDIKSFRDGEYDFYIAGLFFFVWASYYTFYYVASYGIQQLGLSFQSASNLVVIINGCGLPARIVIPWLADRVGPLNVITCCAFFFAIIVWCWLAVSSIPGLYLFTAFAGLLSGAMQSLMPTTIASITKRLDKMGVRLGMMFSIISIATLTGPPIGGAIGSATGGYTAPQIWSGASMLVCIGALLLARWFMVGWNLKGRC